MKLVVSFNIFIHTNIKHQAKNIISVLYAYVCLETLGWLCCNKYKITLPDVTICLCIILKRYI